jgi:hypothetical protein
MDTVSPIGISRQMCAAEWRTIADWLATQRSPNARKLVPLIRQAVADLPDTKHVPPRDRIDGLHRRSSPALRRGAR